MSHYFNWPLNGYALTPISLAQPPGTAHPRYGARVSLPLWLKFSLVSLLDASLVLANQSMKRL